MLVFRTIFLDAFASGGLAFASLGSVPAARVYFSFDREARFSKVLGKRLIYPPAPDPKRIRTHSRPGGVAFASLGKRA